MGVHSWFPSAWFWFSADAKKKTGRIFPSITGRRSATHPTMKSRVGLAVSIGLNLGLAGVLGWLWLQPPAAPPPLSDDLAVLGAEALGSTNKVQIRYLQRPDFRFPTNGFSRFTWRAIESADYRRYVENLRAIRCPEKTIQDIIVADVNELYAGRWREKLTQQAASFRYWQTGDTLPGFPDEALDRAATELDGERRSLLKELLGIDVKDSVAEFGTINPTELTLNFLPEERRQRVMAAQEEFARAQTALLANPEADGIESSLEKLLADHQQKLAALMSPEELRRYEMTTSPLAMALRSELAGFEPTEAEFRQIFEARKQQEEEVEATRVFLGAQIQAQEATEAAEKKAQAELAQTQAALLERLGPERYAQLQRTSDPNFQLLLRVSRTGGLSPITANRVYEYQQVAQVEADRVRANAAFSLEQREVALNGIRAETERTIQESLGDFAARAYREWNEQQAVQRDLAAGAR